MPGPRLYAGIGSRETPPEVLAKMEALASDLAGQGFVLRSGAAAGADAAFELGCDRARGAKDIWLPWRGFNGHESGSFPGEAHFESAAVLHPAWVRLSRGARALHARNVGQVLGADLQTPVEFVLCWTPDGCESREKRSARTGGTGTAIALADERGIAVFNMFWSDAIERLHASVLPKCARHQPAG